jgi:hypothetical protein
MRNVRRRPQRKISRKIRHRRLKKSLEKPLRSAVYQESQLNLIFSYVDEPIRGLHANCAILDYHSEIPSDLLNMVYSNEYGFIQDT